MKKIFFATIIASATALTSCSDFLDQQAESDARIREVYENASMAQLAVNGLYGALTTDRTYGQDLAVTFCNNTDIESVDGMKSDDRHNASNYRGWGNYFTSSLVTDSKNYDMYNELFGITEKANLIISGIEDSKLYKNGSNADKTTMGNYLGEAYTIRALAYLDLIRLYGDVPMNFEPSKDDLSNVKVGKTNRDVILDQLIEDLTKAAELLPWAGENGYTTEKVTKGYALALKAQIALTRAGWAIREGDMNTIYDGKFAGQYETSDGEYADATYPTQRPVKEKRDELYTIAVLALNEILESGVHNLNPSFQNLWYNVNQLQLDDSRENIFEIPFGLNKSGELGYSVGIRLNNQTADYGYTNSTGHMNLTAKLLYDYDANDTRRLLTCGLLTINSTAGQNYSKQGLRQDKFVGNKPFGVACGKWDPRMMSTEWRNININANGKFGYGINYIKMRHAQVLLMFAEALNELTGDPDATSLPDGTTVKMSARNALLKVRNRAYAGNESEAEDYVNSLTASNFFDALVFENELEFAGEGVRKWELIRWNLLCEKIAETRKATVDRKQTPFNKVNEKKWDTKIAYNWQKNTNERIIDETSYSIEKQITSSSAGYDNLSTAFGTVDDNQTDNANYFCSGLIGSSDGKIKPDVKNRYIAPLPKQSISASGGLLQNSYGY